MISDCNEIRNGFNGSIMKMGEIEGAGKELENMKVRVKNKVPNVMKVAVRKIYRRLSEGEMEC